MNCTNCFASASSCKRQQQSAKAMLHFVTQPVLSEEAVKHLYIDPEHQDKGPEHQDKAPKHRDRGPLQSCGSAFTFCSGPTSFCRRRKQQDKGPKHQDKGLLHLVERIYIL